MRSEKLESKNFDAIGRLLNYLLLALFYKRIKLIVKHIDNNFVNELIKFLYIIRHRQNYNISEYDLLEIGTFLINYGYNIYGNQMFYIYKGKEWCLNCKKYLEFNNKENESLLEVIENYENITSSNISNCI